MAKNASYKNVYKITICGRTTNGFTAKILDQIIKTVALAITADQAQSKSEIEVIETSGDYDAINGKYKGE